MLKTLRRLLLLLLVLIVLAVLAVILTPMSFIYRMAEPHLDPSLRLHDVSGTLLDGQARQLTVNGFPLGHLDWRLHGSQLLRGAISASWKIEESAWSAQARTTLDHDRLLRVDDMTMQLPALLLKPVLDIDGLDFLGTIHVELDHLRLRGRIIEETRGRARWVDAGSAGAAQARFGPIHAQFASTRPGGVIGEVQDVAGALIVDGQFELDGLRYHAEVILHARDPADPVARMLHYVGQALPDGGSLLIVSGQLQNQASAAPVP
ncbi:MAG: type II secretion system protein N [Xanthomonadales bacterium]|nr:type II secretion system protein N [Xanthomonadales bacterium]